MERIPYMSVSLIVPAFNEEGNILPFVEAAKEAFEGGYEYEIVFVDDGSSDGTLAEMKKAFTNSSIGNMPTIKIVEFSRNFGKEAALYSGLKHATGEITVFIDSDLQQPPAIARDMVDTLLDSPDIDCIAAYQENRKQGKIVNSLSSFFYKMLGSSSGMDVLSNASDFRAFKSNVKDALLSMTEYYRFSKGLFAWIGFKVLPYPYTPNERAHGESSWSFRGLVKYAISGLLSFTTLPLKLSIWLGLVTSFSAALYMLVVVVQRFAFGVEVPGYATIVSLILLVGGIQLLVLGIAGEYIARIYIEGKSRPVYIERSLLDSSKTTPK